MAAQYVTITKAEMHDVLTARGYQVLTTTNALEYVYVKVIEGYTVLVNTSVDIRTNRSREVGSDAIRVIVLDSNKNVINGEKRVNRSEGWAIRLNARLDNWKDGIVFCDNCGRPMKERKGKYGKFLGCTAYPVCTYTQSIA